MSSLIDRVKSSETPLLQIVNTFRYLYRELYKRGIEDDWVGRMLDSQAYNIFLYFPRTSNDRVELAQDFFLKACESPENAGDLHILRAFLSTDCSKTVPQFDQSAFLTQLCFAQPSLPEIILRDLAHWKQQQYARGLEMMDHGYVQIHFRLVFLSQVLLGPAKSGHTFKFSHELLEEFWETALLRKSAGPPHLGFWGGDAVTESIRYRFFEFLHHIDFAHYGIVLPPGLFSALANLVIG